MPATKEKKGASGDGDTAFTCASCKYSTTDEEDFMKHCKSEHRSELSLWCVDCDKCFSNCGLLVAHVKERKNCVKEDMIYRCGAKECTFKTDKGQVLVHHLRHVHRGSPFLYCVECNKLFTLPHCLILHMQNDCPHKEKHRNNGGTSVKDDNGAKEEKETEEDDEEEEEEEEEKEKEKEEDKEKSSSPEPEEPPPKKSKPGPKSSKPASAKKSRGAPKGSRGGKATRGRKSKKRSSENSDDDDDADDPGFKEESAPLRRSSRSARKIVEKTYDSDDYED